MFTAIEPDVRRNGRGQPLIVPPEGGDPVPYTRATTFVDCLEDRRLIEKWKCRMVATGLTLREDLRLAAVAHSHDREKLNEICEQAIEAAKGSAAAITGTALHALTDRIERGQELGPVPAEHMAALESWRRATEGLEVVAIERFGVLDELKVAGTADRIYRIDGENYVGDTKSGAKPEFGILKIAMQLAIYARMTWYQKPSGPRLDTPPVNQERAIIIRMPQGSSKAWLEWVDIGKGWEYVQLAARVREARRTEKELVKPFEWPQQTLPLDDSKPLLRFDLHEAIARAKTVSELNRLWAEYHDYWTDDHTETAKARKTLIQSGLI